jgi:hypothetical protein
MPTRETDNGAGQTLGARAGVRAESHTRAHRDTGRHSLPVYSGTAAGEKDGVGVGTCRASSGYDPIQCFRSTERIGKAFLCGARH